MKDEELIWLYNSLFFENAQKLIKQNGVKLLLVTDLSAASEYVIERVSCPMDFIFKRKGEGPSFILKDDKELVIIMNEPEKDPTAMYTNYPALVESFELLFGYIWKEPNKSDREPARKVITTRMYSDGVNRL